MMFGHNDEQEDKNSPMPDETLGHDSAAITALPPTDNTASVNDSASTVVGGDNTSNASDYIMTDPAVIPAAVAVEDPTPVTPSEPLLTATTPTSNNELLDIKQQALQQLSPLVGHLDQSPEEKFRTTMMLIQAADNEKLIPQAYEAAQAIIDEKARAQALLDVVNEINYFTQQRDQ